MRPMAQLVCEFWSEQLEPVVSAVGNALGKTDAPAYVMTSGHDDYAQTTEQLSVLVEQLAIGAIVSLSLRPKAGKIRYCLVDSPQAYPDAWPLSGWLGTVEYLDLDYEWLWSTILSTSGLKVACLGMEEAPTLTDATMSPDTFPWDDQSLILGAVRTSQGWMVREGSRFPISRLKGMHLKGMHR
jgi:hypothetical protein